MTRAGDRVALQMHAETYDIQLPHGPPAAAAAASSVETRASRALTVDSSNAAAALSPEMTSHSSCLDTTTARFYRKDT